MVIERSAFVLALISFFTAALLLFLAVLKHTPRRAHWLIALALVLMWASFLHIHLVNREQAGRVYITDVQMFSDYGAALTRMGENPYAFDMLDSYRIYRASKLYSTPLISGDVVGGFSYPALGFLLYLPVQALGIDTTLIYPAALLITLGILYLAAPRAIRPLAVVPFLVNPNYTLYSLGGVNDIVWALMLCLMILSWRRLWLAALIFGLACAYKQQPWFLAPFLLVKLWFESSGTIRDRLMTVMRFALITAGVFALVNAYWFAQDPAAWINGVMRPLFERMVILGQGYSSLTLFGVIMLPQWAFTVFTYGSLALLLILYIRYFEHWREMLWIAPVVALWFGHRSLSSYWYFYLLPLVLALLMTWRREWNTEPETETAPPQPHLWLTPIGIGGLALIVALIAAAAPNPITLERVGAVNIGGTETRITVRVTNGSDTPLTPRFSLQSWGEQPAFWEVLHGSAQVDPGASQTYTLFTTNTAETFNPAVGAQVIVSDAENYGRRASTFLHPAMLVYVDSIPNGGFLYWNADGSAPYGWGLVGIPGSVHLTQATTPDYTGRAVEFTIAPGQSVALDTWLMLPEAPIRLWVNPPLGANQSPEFAMLYGVEIAFTQNGTRFLILFGTDASGTLADGTQFYGIPAPSDQWSEQTIQLPNIIAELGIDIPEPQIRAIGAVQFPMVMTNFRVYAQSNTAAAVSFGEITSVPGAASPALERIAASIAAPADLFRWRAEINLEAGNYAHAVEFFSAALALEPAVVESQFGLGAALFGTGDLARAQAIFEQAAAVYPQRSRLQTLLGEILLAQGDAVGAQVAFNTALELFTRDGVDYGDSAQARIYRGLGDALAAQDRLALAESMYSRAVELDPWDLASYASLYRAFADQGRCDAATLIYDRAALFGLSVTPPPCENMTNP